MIRIDETQDLLAKSSGSRTMVPEFGKQWDTTGAGPFDGYWTLLELFVARGT